MTSEMAEKAEALMLEKGWTLTIREPYRSER